MIDRFEQFFSSISSIYKIIQKIEREEMARYGLKGPHVQCMVAMVRRPEGVTISQLCELCDKDKAAISRDITELEEKGMVERVRMDKIYRAPIRLTEKGRVTACQVSEIIQTAVELAGERLTDEDRCVFYQTLDLIAGNLRRISRDGMLYEAAKERIEENERKNHH